MTSIGRLMNLPITIVRRAAGGVDQYGDDTVTETTSVVYGHFEQTGATETDSDTIARLNGRVWLPAGTTIGPADQITVHGDTWEIDAQPAVWTDPRTGAADHIEARTVRSQ